MYWFLIQQKQNVSQNDGTLKPPLSNKLSVAVPAADKPKLPALHSDGNQWRVLIVDDLPRWAEVILDYSKILPCDIRHATSLVVAAQILKTWKPQLILLDLHMPRDDWKPHETLRDKYLMDQKTLAFCEQITTLSPAEATMVVITSVEKQEVEQQRALDAGAFRFYTKENFRLDDLEELLQILQARTVARAV